MTYDVLGNERHKAVCGLRKLSDSPSDIWVWKRQLGEAIGADNEMYSSINERLIHLLRGGVEPTTLRELFGVLKESGDGVDTGGLAPITTELRNACGDANDMVSFAAIESHDFDRLCDAIDAVHAQLERDYKVACEVNERQDEQYADMVHRLDRAYEKNRNQRKQLTEVQGALHRRNEGELKTRWQKEIDRLERENEELRCQLESLMSDSRPMTVEDVLREFAQEMNENLGMYTGEAIEADEWRDADAKTVEKFAAKLRLAEVEDA